MDSTFQLENSHFLHTLDLTPHPGFQSTPGLLYFLVVNPHKETFDSPLLVRDSNQYLHIKFDDGSFTPAGCQFDSLQLQAFTPPRSYHHGRDRGITLDTTSRTSRVLGVVGTTSCANRLQASVMKLMSDLKFFMDMMMVVFCTIRNHLG